jgi:periplasmic divalent cation tolerance protein
MSQTDVRIVLVTAPSGEVARDLARRLLEERLVACGNVVPGLTSVYRWEGSVQEDEEVLLILKCHVSTLARLVERTAELHPYELPEILALPVSEGLPGYVAWVGRECRPD